MTYSTCSQLSSQQRVLLYTMTVSMCVPVARSPTRLSVGQQSSSSSPADLSSTRDAHNTTSGTQVILVHSLELVLAIKQCTGIPA